MLSLSDDFAKEAISSIREITLQLILIAMGVFALMGGFATAEKRKFEHTWLIGIAFVLLGFSVIFGLLTYGSLIWSLGHSEFSTAGPIQHLAEGQWFLFALGGLTFMVGILLNIRSS